MTINERIEQIKIHYFTDERGNHKKFSEAVGAKSNEASNWMTKGYSVGASVQKRILTAFPEVDPLWLEKGIGEMLISDNSDTNILKEPTPTYGIAKRDSYKLVPLYNWDAVAGMHRFPEVVDMLQYAEMMIPFLGARTDDISIRISNDSMTPTYMPGSIILIREVERWQEYFGYGGVFVILLEDGRRLFKKILKHDSNPSEYVICSSENKAYPDEELPRSLISKVFKLIRCLTDEDF